ncbi:MAG: oxidoreductase [Pseudomonadota bacterium]|nr:oxidoreductase [Pseudomonadota bacterium]
MSNKNTWSEDNIPSQAGKRVLITGANSGIGLAAAKVLAAKGAHVILACRNEAKALQAMATIRQAHPKASLQFLALDLGSLDSVRAMAQDFLEQYDRLDGLINNAGVMWLPKGTTRDGFESQIGINHFGHFALTGLLLPALLKQPGSRIVTVSSIAHRAGNLNFDDLFFERRAYGKHKAYGQSKLANLVFARELERRLNLAGTQTISVAVHPGVSNTSLGQYRTETPSSRIVSRLAQLLTPVLGQSALKGALPTLYAATAEAVQGGDYIGPDGFYEAFGSPAPAASTRRSRNPEIARKLWEVSEQLTGVVYPFESQQAVA